MAWRKAVFKGTEVLARCDEEGNLVADGGRVEIRYRPKDGRAYRAALRNLAPLAEEAPLPDDHCAPVDDATARGRGTASGRGAKRGQPAAAKDGQVEVPENALVAYTDGACSGNPGPAGVGVVLLDGETRCERSVYLGEATNNIAELTAIEVALELVGDTTRPLRIYTDSKYSIGVLTRGWKAKANQALIKRIKERIARLPDLGLVYVPGHAGVPLNERADELAVQAVRSQRSS